IGAYASGDALLRNPITGIAACCARAMSGHAATAPPSAASNSRRPMVTVIRPSRARCVKEKIPRLQRAIFPSRRQNAPCFHLCPRLPPRRQLLANAALAASRVGSQLSTVAVELFGMGITPCHHGGALGDAHIRLPQPHAALPGQSG